MCEGAGHPEQTGSTGLTANMLTPIRLNSYFESFFLCFQEEEETYLQKADRLNSLMNAVTDKVRGDRASHIHRVSPDGHVTQVRRGQVTQVRHVCACVWSPDDSV